ncbi:hypothetical protein ACFE04_027909 [Oxalis oulophora]
MPGRPRKNRDKDPLEKSEDRKLSKIGQLKLCGHCRQPGHSRSTCPDLGRGKGKESHLRNKVGSCGMGLYIDPISARRIPNPGTPLERAIDMHSRGSGSLHTARPPVVSNPPTSTRLETLSSEQSGTSRLSSLALPPLPLEHAGFKRSGVLCIPGNGGLTASWIRGKLTKTTKGDNASSSTRKSKMAKCTQESTNLEK